MQSEIFDFADYEPTGNKAIDLVAQAVGWARKNGRPLKAVILKPSYFDLFRLGLEVLARHKKIKLEITGIEVIELDGVEVRRGNRQWETMLLEFYDQGGKIIQISAN